MTSLPTTGRIVRYRGRFGLQTERAAMVIIAADTLDARGVEAGDVEPLDSLMHAHLWVFAPNEYGGFLETNVPHSLEREPGTWWWPR